MSKNRKVKGFCAFCHDPVITGGKQFGGKWYHGPCYVAHSYGMPQDIEKGKKPRRSAPPKREIRERVEEGWNPVESDIPETKMEILAHANNVTFAMDPPAKGKPQQYYIWHGPRAGATNIVRFPTYNQANQYYRDVIDGKTGVTKSLSRFKTKQVLIVLSVVAAAGVIYWLWKKRQAALTKQKVANKTTSTADGFNGV
jgi:hypothetical protein